MPLLLKMVSAAAGRMPKSMGPSTHALIDYAMAGSYLLAGMVYWRRNKRAAMSAFVCGGVAAANGLLTDYPGGVAKVLSYKTHERVDAGIAALSAAMPRFLEFEDEPEAKFFGMQAVAQSVAMGLTNFNYYEHRPSRRTRQHRDEGVA